MVLVDTNVWIDFYRDRESAQVLAELLEDERVVAHPWIIGELMLGHLGPKKEAFLTTLSQLPQLQEFESSTLKKFIQEEKLEGQGLSYVDVQILYSALSRNCLLWTQDKSLYQTAKKFGIAMG